MAAVDRHQQDLAERFAGALPAAPDAVVAFPSLLVGVEGQLDGGAFAVRHAAVDQAAQVVLVAARASAGDRCQRPVQGHVDGFQDGRLAGPVQAADQDDRLARTKGASARWRGGRRRCRRCAGPARRESQRHLLPDLTHEAVRNVDRVWRAVVSYPLRLLQGGLSLLRAQQPRRPHRRRSHGAAPSRCESNSPDRRAWARWRCSMSSSSRTSSKCSRSSPATSWRTPTIAGPSGRCSSSGRPGYGSPIAAHRCRAGGPRTRASRPPRGGGSPRARPA